MDRNGHLSSKVKQPTKYSFIIPVKNQISVTRDCLLSWFAHIGDFLDESEVLIVDDGSSAQSKPFLRSLPAPVRLIENDQNRGFAYSNNRAVSEAKGEYLVLMNNDLVLQRGWLDAMLAVVNAGEGERVVGNMQISRFTGKVDHVGKYFDEGDDPRHFGQFYEELFPWKPTGRFPSISVSDSSLLVAEKICL